MNRLSVVLAAAAAVSAVLAAKLVLLLNNDEISAAALNKGTYTIKSVGEYAGIYDCNFKPLVNRSEKYEAVIIPNHDSAIRIQPYVADSETYYRGIQGNAPFLCEVTAEAYAADTGAVIFRSAVRTDSSQPAPHIIGYTSDGNGVCGIEKAFDRFLRSNCTKNSARFHVDAVGEVLGGLDTEIRYAEKLQSGVLLTIDRDIQQICENAVNESGISRGAVVVMDVKTGEIRASVSCPDFDTTDVAASLDNADLPFVNRAFSAYSVGSIFKLVTAAAALEQGISPEYTYTCTGSINVNGQVFNCHRWGGHGEIDMQTAMVESCNPYFIALSEYIGKENFVETAKKLGFGQETELCSEIVSASGTLQTPTDIMVEAERANMSFGQGKLTATPLQICRMTAAIANNGVINEPTLIKGIRHDSGTVDYCDIIPEKRVMSYETARTLKLFMQKTVNTENSMAKPDKTIAGGKTSTAQTGQFDEQGNELLNCWFTGYFPSYNPRYAVTVLVEGGVSGNVSAGPIFKVIADDITAENIKAKVTAPVSAVPLA